MEAMMTSVQPFFDWLLETTLIGSVVIGLILAAQKLLGARLGPRWGHALWLVLVIRLLLPGAFPGQINLMSLVPSADRQIQQPSDAADRREIPQRDQAPATAKVKPAQRLGAAVVNQKSGAQESAPVADIQNKSKTASARLRHVLPLLWLTGAVAIGFYLLWSNFVLWRIVKRERPLLNQKILELFEECKDRMGVHTLVGLIPSARIRSPALFGFLRPRLLLPMAMVEEAGPEDLRYIFLHELAHLKHRDIYLGWLTSLLQILHWFNPLLWFAFHRLRADRELSCDALVLSRAGDEESQDYGRAIVGLLRRFSRARPLPAMAGILENQSQLKRRITMIAQFKRGSYPWSSLSVLLILALGVVSLSFHVWSGSQTNALAKSEPGVSLRRIKTGPMSDFSGPPSLDGRYMCDIEPGSDIMRAQLVIRDLTTGEIRPLTEVSRAGMWYPVISPDSTHVAYLNQFYPSPETELQLINLDGTGHRVLHRFNEGEELRIHSWTPDGKQILGGFWNGDKDQLVAFSIENGSMHVIHTFEFFWSGWPYGMAISPDGRFFAYDRPQEIKSKKGDIFILDIEKQQTKCVVQHAADDRLLGWTPDNRYLLFASDRRAGYGGVFSISETRDAYLLPVADGTAQGAPVLVKRDIPAKIRPKGFTRDGAFYYAVEFSTMEVAVAEVDVQTGQLLKKSQTVGQTGTDVTPAWSPDGRDLAYGIQNPDSSQTIRIRNMETGEERELSPNLKHFFSLRWSHDGQSLLASTFKRNFPQAIYRIDATTGEPVILVQNESAALGAAQLSRDGRTLFYVMQQPDTQQARLMARDPGSGNEKELFRVENASNAQSLNYALSPDGRRLALATFETKHSPMTLIRRILTMPAQGGEPKELLKDENLRQYPLIAWTPDGQFLLFNSSSEGSYAIWLIPAGGGLARELCRPQTMMYGALWSALDVHPDGRRIAFDCYEYRHEVWAMENFLLTTAASKAK
jgi:beta-lactamase regulating signal transducer with metallopeptidase domain/Tol biopolymer transport system component